MVSNSLAPGDHVFTPRNLSSVKQLSYTVIPSRKKEGKAPILVMTAVGWGIGRTSNTNGLAPLFLDHFTVVSQSPRGSDQSAQPIDADRKPDPTQMGSHSMADDLESLRQHLDLPSFPVLMGHSNGAAIILAYGQKYPDRVDRLICIDGQLIGYNNKDNFQRYRLERENLPQYKAAYEAWKSPGPTNDSEFEAFLNSILPTFFVGPVNNFPILQEYMKDGPAPTLWANPSQEQADNNYAMQRDASGESKNLADLAKIKAKMLCIWGEDDPICAVDAGRIIVSRIKTAGGEADLHTCHAGHFPWIESPEEFTKSILAWLDVE